MTNLRPPTRNRTPDLFETCSECDHGPESFPQPIVVPTLLERMLTVLRQQPGERPTSRCAQYAVGHEHDICHCTSSFHRIPIG